MTSARSTPICGAARPAPLAACIVSNMSATSSRNSGVPKRSTGLAMRSNRGSPIFRIVWTVIVRKANPWNGVNSRGSTGRCRTQRRNDLGRCLDELDQHPFAGDRKLVVGLRMQEADVVARRALANPAGPEPDPTRREPGHGRGQIVDPQADVIERRRMHRGLAFGIDRLHEVDLDPGRTAAHRADVLVDVFAFAAEVARRLEP